MYTLGLETSTRAPCAALLRGEVALGAIRGEPGKQASARLPVQIREMLGRHGIAPGDIDLIAVSTGPGSFTGLRVGVMMAKTWAWATGAKLVAVPTLEAIARQAWGDLKLAEGALFRVASNAQRQQAFVETRRWQHGQLTLLEPFTIVACDQLSAGLSPDSALVIVEPFAFEPAWPAEKLLRLQPCAASVARLGLDLCRRGLTTDPLQLVPVYGRESAAEERKTMGNSPA